MRLYAALFVIGLVVYGALAGDRLGRPSTAPHFVYQADAWLHGSLAIAPDCDPCAAGRTPLPADDWAWVETVALRDGRVVEGRRMVTRPVFRTLGGEAVPIAEVASSRGFVAYNSFPAVPAVLMLPSALIAGRAGNDVIPTVVLAALILPLALLVLRRLASASLSRRSVREDLWLVALLAFGSVLLFSAVQGKVWFTAHVVGVALALVYAWAAIEARRPVVAGIALGAAALTRTAMAFMVVLFVFEAWRVHGRRGMVRPLLWFAAPVVVFAVLGMLHNHVRFGSPLEFGHSYLALGDHRPVRQQALIEQWGLAHYHYLSRNLAVALALLPDVLPRAPWIQISGHGLALWLTTPALLLLLWPRTRNPLHRTLWLTVLVVALPSLFYMNSGWVQFGYRFCLDYLVFLVMLLAIGDRPLTRMAKGLIIAGIVINLFGALTFDRHWKFYKLGGNAGDVVIPNS